MEQAVPVKTPPPVPSDAHITISATSRHVLPPARKQVRPVSTSLKELIDEKPKEQVEQQLPAVEMNNPFTQEELIAGWHVYAITLNTEILLKNTMINCKPVLQDKHYFEIKVHNQGQQEVLYNAATDILAFLRQQLKNTHIQMRVSISEADGKKPAYTISERYQHLMETNPLLGKLKDEFNLTADE
jgi:DNA polymerase-3 subunit gamma/tau